MLNRRFAGAAIAAAAVSAVVVLAPGVATASTYPVTGGCAATPTVTTPGSVVDFSCTEDTFLGDEDVTVTITGEEASGSTFAVIKTAVSSASTLTRAQSDGSTSVIRITLGNQTTGSYEISAVGETSGRIGTAPVRVVTSSTGGASSGLPVTGGSADSALAPMLVGVGAIVVGGVVLTAGAIARRSRSGAGRA
ncbi:hypothetical protein [Microbacterium sp. 18062]|uniref:hypothetical protein n=1 Tax=Microbacterium sp. 18062 TaxID=2681410 RepID=UPI0013598D1C|nr:hypothetical protein [Microbacterium sp. 18062]